MTDVTDLAEDSDDEGEEAPSTDHVAAAEDLARHGVAVVRVFDEVARAHWEARIYAAMDDFPEYKLQGRGVQRVLGGFGGRYSWAFFGRTSRPRQSQV